VSADGTPLWDSGGVALFAGPGPQYEADLALDGEGGVIAAWSDIRSFDVDVYAQRLNASGQILWAPGGVRVSTTTDDEYIGGNSSSIATDGAGGAILVWDAGSTGTDTDVWAQRIDPNGNRLWPGRGKLVSRAENFQIFPSLATDGSGGAYIVWEDWRSYPTAHVFAQRIDGVGNPYWVLDGTLLSPSVLGGRTPLIVSDGAGGAIVGWDRGDIYAQRLTKSGPTWQEGGISVCSATGLQQGLSLTSTDSGGAIMTWIDRRTDLYDLDAYVQIVDSTGSALWIPDGVPISTLGGSQGPSGAASDGAGGALVAWIDYADSRKNYVQHLNASGTAVWNGNDVLLASEVNNQVVASDGSGGAIVVWTDNRDGIYYDFGEPSNLDIYAARVTTSGNVDVSPSRTTAFKLLPARPNPTRAETVIPFDLPSSATVDLEIFSLLGQRIRSLARSQEFSPGPNELLWDGRSDAGRKAPPGIYLVRLAVGRQSVVGRIVLLR
jgi:hypothetical protein